MIVILSGVSGAGKDTIKRILMRKDGRIKTLPSYTTRDKRINEVEGENYYYVSKEKFKEMIDNNEFYEYSVHHGNYYGTNKKLLNERIKNNIVLKDIDVNGTEDLLKIFRGTEIKIISIFLNISKEEMLRRLENRDDKLKQEEIELRMNRYDYEMNHIGIYDYVIKNDEAEKTSNIILDIITGSIKIVYRSNTKQQGKNIK